MNELIELVGLPKNAVGRYPHEFSGGQRQRAGIARALAVKPEFIAADEAVSALDVSIQAQIINLLAELQKELGLTYLFIAHDLSVVRHISDRIAVMYLGEVVEQSPSYELYRNPLHPYTSALVSAVPIPDPAIETKRRRLILVGDVPSPANPPSGCRFHTRCWLRRELQNPERCVKERPVLRELLPDHTVACHYAEELVAKDRRQELIGRPAEATTGRTVAPRGGPGRRRARRGRCGRQHLRSGHRGSHHQIGWRSWNTASAWPRSRRASAKSTPTSSWRRNGLRRAVGRGRAAGRLSRAGADRLPALGPRAGGGDAGRRPAADRAESRRRRPAAGRIGFVEETDDHRYANSAALLRDGELLGRPSQGLPADLRPLRRGALHPPRRPDPDARRWGSRWDASASPSARTSGTPACRCSRRQEGASLLVNIAAGPARAPGSAAGTRAIAGWHKMQDTYALLGTVAIAFCNRVGNEEGLTFWGGSRLLAADGSVVAEGAALRGGAGGRQPGDR